MSDNREQAGNAFADPSASPGASDGGMPVELRSIDGPSSVILTEWEADNYGVKAAMTVNDCGFAGSYDEVWFFRDGFAAFIRALEQFAVRHEGEACLESMSPGEAMLSIRRLDLARHVLLEAQVSRGHYLGNGYGPFYDRVSVSFEVDPSGLPDIVSRLSRVIADVKRP